MVRMASAIERFNSKTHSSARHIVKPNSNEEITVDCFYFVGNIPP